MESRSQVLVELAGAGRRYRVGANEVVALADVSLRVAAEDLVVVLGPSGSGKTTLLNIIGALDSPTEDGVVVAGNDITNASKRELFEFRRHAVWNWKARRRSKGGQRRRPEGIIIGLAEQLG